MADGQCRIMTNHKQLNSHAWKFTLFSIKYDVIITKSQIGLQLKLKSNKPMTKH